MNTQKPPSLSERVLERIGAEHLRPRSRWSFVLENWFFWALGALALLLGSLASAAALFEVANTGWDFYAATHHDLLTLIIEAAPYLWLLVLAFFVFVGYENIRHTKRGYRYPLPIIVIGSVLTSVVLGAALFAAGFGQEVEEAVGGHVPFYQPVLLAEHAHWLAPARGLLGGMVVSVSSTSDTFTLKSFDGSLWTIDAGDLSTTSAAAVERGGVVRVIAVPSMEATSTLHGCAVSAWKTYGTAAGTPETRPFGPFLRPERSAPSARMEVCKGASPYRPPRAASGE